MYDTIHDLLDALKATPETLLSLLQGSSPEEARLARGGDENWSVIEIICHLRDAEERALERNRLMRDEENPWLEGYDQEQWATERSYATAKLDSALNEFLRLRAVNVSELAALKPEEWERAGTHEEVGIISITGQMIHMVSHDAIHLAQIARQLAEIRQMPK